MTPVSAVNSPMVLFHRLPVELVYTREFETRSEAMREEVRIKRLPRAEKRALAAGR